MRICVTGAAGKVGHVACGAVLAAGHELVATDRRIDPDHPGRIVYADLLDPVACHRVVEGCAAVIHLGNHPDHWGRRPQQVFGENGVINGNLCQAALEQGVERVVFASSIQVVAGPLMIPALEAGIASALPCLPLAGDTPQNPGNVYAASKAAGEQLMRSYAHQAPERSWIALRLPAVVSRPWQRWIDPHPGNLRDELFTTVHADDAGRLLLAAATRGRPGYHCYQAGSRELSIDRELAEVLATWFADVPLRPGTTSLAAPVDLEVLAAELDWTPRSTLWAAHAS